MAHELILIVDDNEQNRKLARDVLQFAGFRTLEAAGGVEGLSLAVEHRPDLILMDIRMPDMNGTEAVRKLREDERTAAIRVVALTSSTMKGDRERFLADGFDGYLEKPIRVREFPDQIRSTWRDPLAAVDTSDGEREHPFDGGRAGTVDVARRERTFGWASLVRAVARVPLPIRAKQLVGSFAVAALLALVAVLGLVALGQSNSRGTELRRLQQQAVYEQLLLTDATQLKQAIDSRPSRRHRDRSELGGPACARKWILYGL